MSAALTASLRTAIKDVNAEHINVVQGVLSSAYVSRH